MRLFEVSKYRSIEVYCLNIKFANLKFISFFLKNIFCKDNTFLIIYQILFTNIFLLIRNKQVACPTTISSDVLHFKSVVEKFIWEVYRHPLS